MGERKEKIEEVEKRDDDRLDKIWDNIMVYDKEMKVKEKKKIVGKYRMMRKEKEEKEMGLY